MLEQMLRKKTNAEKIWKSSSRYPTSTISCQVCKLAFRFLGIERSQHRQVRKSGAQENTARKSASGTFLCSCFGAVCVYDFFVVVIASGIGRGSAEKS